MITIKLDEKSIFTFNKETLSIHISDHKDGRYTGDIREIGKIQFDNEQQAYQFMEMLGFIFKEDITKQ